MLEYKPIYRRIRDFHKNHNENNNSDWFIKASEEIAKFKYSTEFEQDLLISVIRELETRKEKKDFKKYDKSYSRIFKWHEKHCTKKLDSSQNWSEYAESLDIFESSSNFELKLLSAVTSELQRHCKSL